MSDRLTDQRTTRLLELLWAARNGNYLQVFKFFQIQYRRKIIRCMVFFQKIQILFCKCDLELFSVLKISPGGHNQVLLGVKIECIHSNTDFVWIHSILTLGSTLFWPLAALDFDPQGLFSKLKKAITYNFKSIFFKATHLKIFLRFDGNFFFLLLNPFKRSHQNV